MELAIRHQNAFTPGYERAEERKFMHYSNLEGILLVGEGDFSFSSVLAKALGSAFNIIATSLDSREKLLTTYRTAWQNLCDLEWLGGVLMHGVDATTMDKLEAFRETMFDKIVYNFPHAGFFGCEADKRVIKKHRRLMKGFFKSAVVMLSRGGEIHVTHKEKEPYNKWKLEKQAKKCGLYLKEAVDFHVEDYPGYTNRRGQGANCGGTFHLGPCKTYKFISSNFFYETLYLRQVKPKFAKEGGSSRKSRKRKHTPNEEGSMLCSLMGIQWPGHFEHGYGFYGEEIECCRPVNRGRHKPFEEGYVAKENGFSCESRKRKHLPNEEGSMLCSLMGIPCCGPVKRGRHEPFEEEYVPFVPPPASIDRHGLFEKEYVPFVPLPDSLSLTVENAQFSPGISAGIQWPGHFEHGYEFHCEEIECFGPVKRGRHERFEEEYVPFVPPPASIERHELFEEEYVSFVTPPASIDRHELFEKEYVPFVPLPDSLRLTVENAQFSPGISAGRQFSHFSSHRDPMGRQIATHRNEGILQTFRPSEKPLPIFRPPASLRLNMKNAQFSEVITTGRHFPHFFSHGDPVARQVAMHRNEGMQQSLNGLGFARY